VADRIRIAASEALVERDAAAVRVLLDAAFDGDFSDDDWAHALGGTHAILERDGALVAHASVVPRVLDAGGLRIHAGYVEAVAVHPSLQRTGLGSAVMRAIGEVVARDFALGALSTGEWPFYARLGWERWQGPTWVRFPDGRRERTPDDDDSLMILRTGASPALDVAAPLTCEARTGDHW
jgi:aminoglycoside 2'-N-acetyltransferase I